MAQEPNTIIIEQEMLVKGLRLYLNYVLMHEQYFSREWKMHFRTREE